MGTVDEQLDEARAARRRLAASLRGEDAEDPDVADRGDQAQQLEGEAELTRLDERIERLEHLAAAGGLAEGTVVTLRYPDGEQATLRVVALAGEADGDDVVTADSPLGQALVGHGDGDTVTYAGPDGDLQVEVLAIRTSP